VAIDASERRVRATHRAPGARATIDDVARAARVSRQTVSNVVRGRGRVGAETGQRVREAIDALDYHPHRGARSMRSRRSWQIALLVGRSPLSSGYVPGGELLRALIAAASAREHHLLLGRTTTGKRADIEELIHSGSVDGFLIADLAPNDPRVEMLAGRGVPFAAFGRTEPDLPQSWVDLDLRGAARTATEHLVAAGHRRVAFVGHPGRTWWNQELKAGYRDAATSAGLPGTVLHMPHDPAIVDQQVGDLLVQRDAPTAIVTATDSIAAAVYLAAARRGRIVGADLAVAGVGHSTLAAALTPSLTAAVFSAGHVAERLVARVLGMLTGPEPRSGELVEAALETGQSS
jgi:DNA-binding LacI/PurR family transcriptional regulator